MKLLMRDEAKGREHTIFVTIFSALMVMLAIVVMLMASATAVSGVTLQLDKNAVDILDKQVENRAGYIQDQLQQAQELTDLSTYINETAQQMLDDETLSLKTLDSSSSDSLPLLQAAAPRMLETLRSKRISGIFLILNTHDFTDRTSGDRLPCVYLRDLDPDAVPSVVNSDILLECAPSELVQTFDITTDKAWSPALQYLDGEQDVFYVRPFQTAYEDDERMGAANYGRWTTLPYKLLGLAVLLTLGIGLACAFFVSYGLAQPVAQLSKELVDAQEQRKAVPEFSRTGIRELDQLAEAIVTLSTDNYKAAVAERSRIEHERDYDALTGLYSRQAFFRVCGELFEKPNTLRHAALMMTDLDNLKTINDTYGHDWGDVYLRQTAHSLQQGSPSGTVVARLSGDEFLLLFYGYETREALRADIKKLEENFAQSSATLPDGKRLCIRMSGGVAWYPEDALDLETLKKYADFAMYEVKHSTKGEVREFDMERYRAGVYAMEQRSDFEKLIRERRVDYHFQPIVSAHDGHVVAYEALMRPQLPTLRSPLTVMQLASEMGRLYDIEKLTFFRACECYEELEAAGKLDADALIFVNSIASVSLSNEDWASYCEAHSAILPKLVVEITEEEEMNERELERKRNVPGSSGVFALDDYGSGYSNGNSLLTIAPKYVKVDIAIIRGIDTDADKQQFLMTLIDYAHPRGVQVLAEGVETLSELRKVLEMGVDLLQGYCLAPPAAEPGAIDEKAAEVIAEVERQKAEREEAGS